MTSRSALIPATILTMILSACSAPPPSPTPPPPQPPAQSSSEQQPQAQESSISVVVPPSSSADTPKPPEKKTVTVSIANFAFTPASLRIAKGTTVTWTNNDTAPHRIDADEKFPGSPTLTQGQSYSYTFQTAGTFPYYCAIHPSMKATIEVTE